MTPTEHGFCRKFSQIFLKQVTSAATFLARKDERKALRSSVNDNGTWTEMNSEASEKMI